MTLARGRIQRGAEDAHPVARPLSGRLGRRVSQEEASARDRAEQVLRDAETQAASIVQRAREEAQQIRALAAEEGRAESVAALSAAWLALRAEEARARELALARVVQYATLLAERLLGRSLREDPSTIGDLARVVLSEAGGAGRVVFRAHPEDAPHLAAALRATAPDGDVHEIVADPALSRGDLLLETESGSVEARLDATLARLSAELREALRP